MTSRFRSGSSVTLLASALTALGFAFGCGDDESATADGSGGSSDTGGKGGGAGSGTGGRSGTSGAAGDPGSAGEPGTGGTTSSGGTSGTSGTSGAAGAGGDSGATVEPVLTVDLASASLLPEEQEFVLVSASDDQGRPDTLRVTSSDGDVATASVIGTALVIQAGTTTGEAEITVRSGSGLRKTVEVIVSDPRAIKIGDDLLVGFVHQFDPVWSDGGTGSDDDGSYWAPRLTSGFQALGHYGRAGYDDPSGTTMMVVAKALSSDALAVPEDFVKIWGNGTAGGEAGSFWRPVCPANYKALGSVAHNTFDKPPLDVIRCVRSDLAEIGAIGNFIWDDTGSDADSDFSSWYVTVPPGTSSIGTMPVEAGTFLGLPTYTKPTSDETANILRLDLPIVRDVDLGTVFPELTSLLPPEETTPVQKGRSILIPFFGVSDPARTFLYKVTTSPFYRLDRDVYYRRLLHQYNQTSVEQPISHAVTTGVSTTRTEQFSIETGISISTTGGVNLGVASASTTVTVSLKLGYSTSTAIGEFMQESLSKEVVVPPRSAAALWQLIHRFTLKRRNGNTWETIGTPWEIGVNSFVVDQYPD